MDSFEEQSSADAETTDIIPAVVDSAPLTTDQARSLTHTIRDAAEVLWSLIARAHAGKAWQALGYPSWEAYVRSEFDMSRSRSYQILDQARVIAAIESAVPQGTEFHVSEAAARELKTVMDEALPEIKERTAGLEPEEAGAVVEQVIAEQRERVADAKNPEEPSASGDLDDADDENITNLPMNPSSGEPATAMKAPQATPVSGGQILSEPKAQAPAQNVDVARIRRNVNAAHDLYSSLSALASLPEEIDEILAIIPSERRHQINEHLDRALEKLNGFAELWRENSDDEE